MRTWLSELVAEWHRIFLDPGAALILVGALVLYAVFYPIPYRANVLERVPVVVVDPLSAASPWSGTCRYDGANVRQTSPNRANWLATTLASSGPGVRSALGGGSPEMVG